MSKYRPDALSLFYFKDRHEAEIVFNDLIAIDDANCKAKSAREARKRLHALLDSPQHNTTKEFIQRILPLEADRMKRTIQTAIRRVFTSTHHYRSGLIHRADKARTKNKERQTS